MHRWGVSAFYPVTESMWLLGTYTGLAGCRPGAYSLKVSRGVRVCPLQHQSVRFAEIQVVPRKNFRPEPMARDVFC